MSTKKGKFPPDRAPLILTFDEMVRLRITIERRVAEIEQTLSNPKRALETARIRIYDQEDILRRPKEYKDALKTYRSIKQKMNRI